jgi:hypothetical protein
VLWAGWETGRPFSLVIVHDLLAAAVGHLQQVAGSTFTVDGVSGTFTGVYNRHQYSERLSIGGYEEDVDATLIASKDQFEGAWTPVGGKRLFVQSKAHKVLGVTEDEWSFTFTLTGVNK